jgi:hypothetical protein
MINLRRREFITLLGGREMAEGYNSGHEFRRARHD